MAHDSRLVKEAQASIVGCMSEVVKLFNESYPGVSLAGVESTSDNLDVKQAALRTSMGNLYLTAKIKPVELPDLLEVKGLEFLKLARDMGEASEMRVTQRPGMAGALHPPRGLYSET